MAGGSTHSGSSASGGLAVTFERSGDDPVQAMAAVGDAVIEASVEAVVKTAQTLADRVRAYVDSAFTGSRVGRRRPGNAIQLKEYNELADKGQFGELVYSKLGRGHGPDSFVDYLLLHMSGGTVFPRQGDWLKVGGPPVLPTGVFFVKSADGSELFALRRNAVGGKSNRAAQLIATFVKSVTIPARLSGLQALGDDRAELFERFFDDGLAARGAIS